MMIDKERFSEQFSLIDDETTIEIINLFLDEKKERFLVLHKNLQEKDYTQLARNCHSLKGTIGSFMAPVPFQLVSSLEKNVLAMVDPEIEKCLQYLEEACKFLAEELENMRTSLISER